jgi:hypothetical protein
MPGVIEDAGWGGVGEPRFDDPELFAAYARTVRWGCVTATDPSLFQAPFRPVLNSTPSSGTSGTIEVVARLSAGGGCAAGLSPRLASVRQTI